jgi:hypothetical protein
MRQKRLIDDLGTRCAEIDLLVGFLNHAASGGVHGDINPGRYAYSAQWLPAVQSRFPNSLKAGAKSISIAAVPRYGCSR